ncbi:MAG: hypothetical protein ACK5AW_10265, partial [Pseudanabaena sp.]
RIRRCKLQSKNYRKMCVSQEARITTNTTNLPAIAYTSNKSLRQLKHKSRSNARPYPYPR